jgi:hypothetical protein
MLISHRHRFLYFVVPKCASATLRRSLAPYADIGWPVSNFEQHVNIRRFKATEHAGLLEDYFKFTFVRNPYDRIYSGYLQDRHAGENYPRWIRAKKPIFDQIGDDFPRYFNDHVLQSDIVMDWRWICFCPMVEFSHADGEPRMDFVGRAETVEEDIRRLSERLGLPVAKADDENVRNGLCTPEPKYLDRYDRRTLAAVNRVYAEDFRLFGYEMIDPERLPERVS